MKKFLYLVPLFLLSTLSAKAVIQTGTIQFGTNGVKINSTNVSFTDDLGKGWTIMSAGTATPSFVQEEGYSQIGNSDNSKQASSISIQINIGQKKTITNAAITMCGYTNCVYLKAGNQQIGSGSANSYTVSTIYSTDNSMQDAKVNIQISEIYGPIRIYSITYSYDDGNAETYSRSGLTLRGLGTICLPYATSSTTGATFYSVAGVTRGANNQLSSVVFDEVTGQLEAGTPYLYQATASELAATYTGPIASTAQVATGLVGNLSSEKITVPAGCYILKTDGLLHIVPENTNVTVGANKAYFDLRNVPNISSPSAPGRIFMDVQAPQEPETATSVWNASESSSVQKIMENGQLIIIKDGVRYDTLGQTIQ